MIEYRVLLALEASDKLRRLRKKDQEALIGWLKELKNSPFDEGDSRSNDFAKPLFIKGINKYLISYYTDHASKEIHVTDILHINDV